MHAKTDSEVTSLAPSSPRSPRRPVYYVQSPSRDSNDGEKTTTSFQSTPVLSPVGSPPHSHSSVGRHSRESSTSRFSGSLKPGSRKISPNDASRGSHRKGQKRWKECDVIEEEGLLEDEERQKGLPRRCYLLAFVLGFFALFSLFSLILWGASRPQKPEITMKSITIEQFTVQAGSDSTGVATEMITVNSTLRLIYRNTGTFFGVHVTSSPIDLSFSDIAIASGSIKSFYQSRRSQRLVAISITSDKIPLYGSGGGLSSSTGTTTLPIPLKLSFTVKSKAYVLGKLVKPKFYKRIDEEEYETQVWILIHIPYLLKIYTATSSFSSLQIRKSPPSLSLELRSSFFNLMALQHLFQQHYQPPQQQPQPQPPKSFRDLYSIDGRISDPAAFFNAPNLLDQSQHPPYVPPFHVVGFAPGPGPVTDGIDGVVDLQWNCGLEPKRKRLKEQDFFENNSQISSVSFLHARSVSTGLGLSLDNTRASSSGDSALLSLIGDDIEHELQRQDAEMDRFLRVQVDQLRQNIIEKVQGNQVQTISLMEEKVLQKLHEKEAEIENINKKNVELEERMEQLSVEAGAWQQRARFNENMINALKFNLQHVYAQSRDSKEGCGDSEVDDTASCCNGRANDFHLLCKGNNDMKVLTTCKFCRVKEVCMLLLPCKHLCLCKDCESKLSFCPLCQSSKYFGIEVYM
ncbi:hypothetical protein K2173_026139 [Erythroxylum novogranatense]|uniref:RING-type domain-containing protein n=1 Tax=Erythroxylum novogranatense TaxID=1862640 RepID=A0AAV8TAP9_9ROSI|nr:hypothetical protein K2173_026139 [Erythroxylum novogranatense]